jgi:hypothetical protein
LLFIRDIIPTLVDLFPENIYKECKKIVSGIPGGNIQVKNHYRQLTSSALLPEYTGFIVDSVGMIRMLQKDENFYLTLYG